jgi:hypothetical protein
LLHLFFFPLNRPFFIHILQEIYNILRLLESEKCDWFLEEKREGGQNICRH